MDLPEDLVTQIATAPDGDRDVHGVLADWLTDRGHPLGELITLALALTPASLSKDGIARHAELQTLLAPTPRDVDSIADTVWRWGLVDEIAFAGSPAELRLALANIASRCVRALRIRLDTDDARDPYLEVLEQARLPALRELHIIDDNLSHHALELDDLLARLPLLHTLHVDGAVAGIAHPTLRTLHLRQSDYLPATTPLLATPRLETLRWLIPPPFEHEILTLSHVAVASNELPSLVALDSVESIRFDEYGTITERLVVPDRRSVPLEFVDAAGRTTPITGDAMLIGRDPTAGLVVPDGQRRHATLERDDDTWILTRELDFAPTRLFGVPVRRAAIRAGDELMFGFRTYRVQPLGLGSSTSSSPVQYR